MASEAAKRVGEYGAIASEAAKRMVDPQRPYDVGDYVLPGRGTCSKIMLPLRVVVWILLMCTLLPLLYLTVFLTALYRRIFIGRPSQILKYGTRGPAVGGMYYPAMMAFKKPFDRQKLTDVFLQMAREAGYPEEKTRISFEGQAPNPFPARSGAMEADHYVETGKYQNWFVGHVHEHRPAPTHTTGLYRGDNLFLRVFNGPPGSPTVLNIGLDGACWDGSSCFNFMKELTNRYCGGQPLDFHQRLKLPVSEESAKKLDDWSFLGFWLHATYAIVTNCANSWWRALESCCLFGGPTDCQGTIVMCLLNATFHSNKMALINFSEEDSKRLLEGCSKLGIKPFAAMTNAAVHSFKDIRGHWPHCIQQQCSLQTRHFPHPEQKGDKLDRNYVGDWLVGPLQYPTRIGSGEYSLQDAMVGYKGLLGQLDDIGEPVKRAYWAKAYGLYTQGSALFECPVAYPDDSRLADSIFFNNYGVRSVHPDSGFHSWNWGAPFALGFNTICVNGVTTITCASSFLGLPALRALRDRAEHKLRLIMDGIDPATVKYAPPEVP
mmetsp:Transcript_67483/g.190231  ORF Transcript_67483/g.190231 Transcript_67483/m.190231 type:complete len:548 (+) Transcript_67483:67-1710(+)